ncbi:probable ATP-dependent RNA helicase DDX43 [Adelges cooleyi]|uniref:probable ATP-dependent RNA helicase DDX43 n=1 Tax=Adelges cooleyi TaxID=133065 RepID=UPI00217F9530|nr:probable ATP-dependent RNA helicase DDX43 [Adelges cooleyi]
MDPPTMFEIESRMSGMLIGRRGVKINSIQESSGAKVQIVDSDTLDVCKVKIRGTQQQQKVAVDLIEAIVGKVTPMQSEPSQSVPRRQNRQFFAAEQSNQPVRKTRNQRQHKQKRSERMPSPPEVLHLSEEAWAEIRRENEEMERKQTECLQPILKQFYVEHQEIKAMSDKDVKAFRLSKNNIMVNYVRGNKKSKQIPKPVISFEHAFHNYPEVMKQIKKQNFTIPTPIQCQAWPIIMSGHDLIGIAQTGTGKTLAFILPALIHLERQPTPRNERIGPSVLILGPTRELVIQIETEVKKYTYNGINVVSVYGGASMNHQQDRLNKERPEIIVATPGRLNDFVSTRNINTTQVSFLVLDEADRMLDMGFEVQIEAALMNVRPDRQTVLTSATWPIGVQYLAEKYTDNSLHVTIGTFDLTTVNTVKQQTIVTKEYKKDAWLENYMKNLSADDKIIIFMRKKVSVDSLYSKLCSRNINCRCIHGGREQAEREKALQDMRDNNVSVLIATDVASRGIDIQDITVVINYDFPTNIEEYVHRVGRTGRAGKTGSAITLFTQHDAHFAEVLIDILDKSNQHVPNELHHMVKQYNNETTKENPEANYESLEGRSSQSYN